MAPVQVRLSPNHGSRGRARIRWVVLHADVSPKESATLDWICSPASEVSYHVLVHRDGTLTRCVPDDRAAWACGKSEWKGVQLLNRHSLSLAFSNRHSGAEYLTAAQVAAAKRQIKEWTLAYPLEDIVTHAMISPGRKSDPEKIPNFDLDEFRRGLPL